MVKYILKRLVQLVVVLLGVTFLTFMITQAAPSDAAEMKYVSMGMMPSSELLEKTREEMGLNDPVLIQYGRWLGNVLHGDLGESSKFGESVWTQMTRKLPMTLKLAGVSLVAVILISFPLGVLSAVKKNKTADYIIRFLSFFGVSMPNFWLALLLMYIFAVRLGWFKVVSTDSIGGMILPVATLTIPMISSYARQIRAALLEELNANYVIGARARGIPERRIIWGHVLPNAILPIITLLGLSVGHLLGGAAIIETIFSWQGIGNMVVEAIRVRDYPLILGYVIWLAIIYVTVNLIRAGRQPSVWYRQCGQRCAVKNFVRCGQFLYINLYHDCNCIRVGNGGRHCIGILRRTSGYSDHASDGYSAGISGHGFCHCYCGNDGTGTFEYSDCPVFCLVDEVRKNGQRTGFRHSYQRLHYRSKVRRCRNSRDSVPICTAEYRSPSGHYGDLGCGRHDAGSGWSVVPRSGFTAADTGMGLYALRGQIIFADSTMDHAVCWIGDFYNSDCI